MSEALHEAVQTRLHSIGQRYTPKRRALVEALVGARNPVAVPQLTHGRDMPQSSLYRNLAVLEQAGAVHRVVTQGEFTRYELAEDLTHHHHHLVCRNCGTVEDVAVPASLERQVQRSLADVEDRTGFAAVGHRLDLIGICRNCA